MDVALIDEITRIFILSALPIVLAAIVGGVLSGVIQGTTSISDHSIGFSLKLVAVLIALAWVGPATFEMIYLFALKLYGG